MHTAAAWQWYGCISAEARNTSAPASINRPSCYLTHLASIRDILSSLPRCLLLLQLPFLLLRFVHAAAKSMNGIRRMEARLLCPVGLFVSYVAVIVLIRATDLVKSASLGRLQTRGPRVAMGVPKVSTRQEPVNLMLSILLDTTNLS